MLEDTKKKILEVPLTDQEMAEVIDRVKPKGPAARKAGRKPTDRVARFKLTTADLKNKKTYSELLAMLQNLMEAVHDLALENGVQAKPIITTQSSNYGGNTVVSFIHEGIESEEAYQKRLALIDKKDRDALSKAIFDKKRTKYNALKMQEEKAQRYIRWLKDNNVEGLQDLLQGNKEK